jgi:hypothetical protein
MTKRKNQMNKETTLRRICSRAEAAERLGTQVFRDAIAAGWLAPRVIKKGRTERKPAKILFAIEDVERVEDRILAGEYPVPSPIS